MLRRPILAILTFALASVACDEGASSSTSPAAAGSTGGVGGAPGGSGVRAPDNAFTLAFRDDFERLDLGRWQLMTHSWPGNLALFAASQATVADGSLSIR